MPLYLLIWLIWMALKGIVILLAIATPFLLAWWIRVALRNRRARWALIAFSCVMIPFAVYAAYLFQQYQSPTRVLERSRAIPLLKSVTILHSYQRTEPLDSTRIWLHFTISPQDFDTIVSSGGYTKPEYKPLNLSAYDPPRWWNISHLGGGYSYYQCAAGSAMGYPKCSKEIVVNAEKTEAFLSMYCWFDD